MGEENSSKIERESLKEAKRKLKKEGYGIVGDHSGVQICLWTKNSLRGKGHCWKEEFYGINSSGCCQMTPSLFHCENKCLHCWRNLDYTSNKRLESCDSPKEILDGIVKARKELLMGFKGRRSLDLEKFEKVLEPSFYTMSLSGEPTLYPKLGEMFREIRRRGAVSFLVTNGLNPEVIRDLEKKGLPTQITVSTNAPNEKLFISWHRSSKKDAWKKFNETLDVLRSLKGKVRRAIRLTLVKRGGEGNFKDVTNMLDEHIREYVDLIRKAEPDFIHVKGFKSLGYARDRMGYEKQPLHKEIVEFAKKLEKELGGDYKIQGEYARSCVVMLARKGVKVRIEKG